MDDTKLLTTRYEAGGLLRVSESKIDHLVKTGQLPACRVGRRVLIPRYAIDEMIKGKRCTT